MKQTLSTNEAAHLLASNPDNGFSYSGALAVIEYLEEIDEDMEFDAVAIRCDFNEYDSLVEFAEDYFADYKDDLDIDEDMDEDDVDDAIRNYIEENGVLIEFSGGIITGNF